MADTHEAKQLLDVLKHFDVAMLATHSADEGIHARPMAIAELRPDGDVYLVTDVHSGKAKEIESEGRATLVFQSDNRYACLSGEARLEHDRSLVERLWKEPWKVWFPKGKDDPSIVLIRFDTHFGEYWDNAGAQGVRYALRAAKAYVSGHRPGSDPDQHGKARLD